jgi:hypothetical protein
LAIKVSMALGSIQQMNPNAKFLRLLNTYPNILIA